MINTRLDSTPPFRIIAAWIPFLDSGPRMGYSAFLNPDQVVCQMPTNCCHYSSVKTLAIILLLGFCQGLSAESPLILGPYGSQDKLNEVTDYLNTNKITFLLNNDEVRQNLGFIVTASR